MRCEIHYGAAGFEGFEAIIPSLALARSHAQAWRTMLGAYPGLAIGFNFFNERVLAIWLNTLYI